MELFLVLLVPFTPFTFTRRYPHSVYTLYDRNLDTRMSL